MEGATTLFLVSDLLADRLKLSLLLYLRNVTPLFFFTQHEPTIVIQSVLESPQLNKIAKGRCSVYLKCAEADPLGSLGSSSR